MSGLLGELKEALEGQAETILSNRERRYRVTVEPDKIVDGAKILFDDFQSRFMTATCVDEGLDFNILYHFDIRGEVVTLGTSIPKEDPRLQSISLAVPTAQWIEREISDLFGIVFEGHPQPEDLIAAESWSEESPPLQKPREGDVIPEYRGAVENVISTGAVVSLSSFTKRKREEAGLAPTTITIEDKEGLEELHTIMKRSKADERAGFDWKKKKLRYK